VHVTRPLPAGRVTAASLAASLSQMGAPDVLFHVPDMISYADPDQDGQVRPAGDEDGRGDGGGNSACVSGGAHDWVHEFDQQVRVQREHSQGQ
jgi:hypothetical protein